MNRIKYYSVSLLLIMGVSCSKNSSEGSDKHGNQAELVDDHHSHETHSHEGHNHSHEGHSHDLENHASSHEADGHEDGVIEMSPEDAKFFGVEVTEIIPSTFSDGLQVNGMVLQRPDDVSNAVSLSSGIVKLSSQAVPGVKVSKGTLLATIDGKNLAGGDSNAAAYQQMIAAKKELERVTPLHADGIVSTRDFNAAEAAYKQALAAYSGSQTGSKVQSNISGTISDVFVKDGDFVESGTVIATVSRGESVMLKVNVPIKSLGLVNQLADANIKIAGSDHVFTLQELNGHRVNGQPSTMSGAYVPVYYTLDNNGMILPGMPVEVFLKINPRENVITVPLAAVTEQQGAHFVFQQLDEDCYKKIPVTLGSKDGQRVEILSGLHGGEKIVTKGMIYVKLAESNGAVPEGHSHSH